MTSLPATLKDLAKEFGDGSIFKLGSREALDIEAISTGCLPLDKALGIGGVPRGRIVEIVGPESSGKTTLAYHLLAEAQKAGDTCAFIDTEHALDPAYAKTIGVDTDELLVSQPDFGEQALEIVDQLVTSGGMGLIVVDSVAGLTPRAELEGQVGEQTVGLQARLMSQALRKLAPHCNQTNTALVFTNQFRAVINSLPFGPTEAPTGGKALKYFASQRLDIRRIETLKQGDEAVGSRTRVRVVKNKTAPPLRQAEFDIDFGLGISHPGCLIDLGLEKGVVQKNGSYFAFGETKLGQGRHKAKAFLRENPEIAEQLEGAL